ncbi:MAG: pyruvate oxidase [Enterococcaceae bacterium]|jgi:pyruvate oxidase|nr:pyruvate oxidase [Enterococcaceae bacterium]
MIKINAAVAMLKVMEAWGIDHVFGLPGGSINSTVDALHSEKERIKYIQVRNEEGGALAAAAEAKLTGKVSACFGSAGPGATHLIQGLYDARMDGAPVLVLLGQVATGAMNTYGFQELNENPMFNDVAVYNRTVTSAQNLPLIIDEAIKEAYEQNGPAVVTIPVDLGFAEIADGFRPTTATYQTGVPLPKKEQLEKALPLIAKAKQPVLYIGQGLRGGFPAIKKFCEHFNMPVAAAVLAKGIVPDDYENFLGFTGRVATKPGVEALLAADLIICAGSNMPFGRFTFNPKAKFIQIDIDVRKFGLRHEVDLAIFGDGITALEQLTEMGASRSADKWLAVSRENIKNWHAWRHSFDETDTTPLRVEPVFKELNKIAEEDAIFVSDVGNVTINSVRHIEMNGKQGFTTSGWFATMGYAVPGGIGAQMAFPDKQVITISGDGGFGMNMQEIITQAKYDLPIINIVLTNDLLGFIKPEQEQTNRAIYGVDLYDADFGKAAEAMGAEGFTITSIDQLPLAFAAAKKSHRPVVIEVKTTDEQLIPMDTMKLDPTKFSQDEIKAYQEKYVVHDMPSLAELLQK